MPIARPYMAALAHLPCSQVPDRRRDKLPMKIYSFKVVVEPDEDAEGNPAVGPDGFRRLIPKIRESG